MTFLGVAILALLAGLITVVVNAGRHRESLDARNVRRVFQYAVLYALVVVSAIGATELLGRLDSIELAGTRTEPGHPLKTYRRPAASSTLIRLSPPSPE